jgi:hypothetical protein
MTMSLFRSDVVSIHLNNPTIIFLKRSIQISIKYILFYPMTLPTATNHQLPMRTIVSQSSEHLMTVGKSLCHQFTNYELFSLSTNPHIHRDNIRDRQKWNLKILDCSFLS